MEIDNDTFEKYFKKNIWDAMGNINENIKRLSNSINQSTTDLIKSLKENELTAGTLNRRLLLLNWILAIATSVIAIAGTVALFIK